MNLKEPITAYNTLQIVIFLMDFEENVLNKFQESKGYLLTLRDLVFGEDGKVSQEFVSTVEQLYKIEFKNFNLEIIEKVLKID